VLLLVFGVSQPVFLTPANLVNAISSVAVLWFIAIGATFVVISGGIDLSSGAVAAASGILFAQLLLIGLPSIAALVVTILFGAVLAGLTNGAMIGYLGLNVFVVTLATMISFTGVRRRRFRLGRIFSVPRKAVGSTGAPLRTAR